MADYWPQIITAAAGVVGALTGGTISYFSQRAFRAEDARRDRDGLALAIASEFEAFCDLMLMRDHSSSAKALIAQAAQGDAVTIKNWITDYERDREIFPILKANLDKLGALGPICGDIAQFYARISAVRTTVIAFQEGNYAAATPEQQAALAAREIDIWENALKNGKWIAAELRRLHQ